MFNQELLKDITVLYAEDSKMMRMQTTEFLEKYFKKVIVAEDGLEGYNKFVEHEKEIDIIVSDIVMPNMTGLEMVSKIRETHKHIPCLMATSIIDPEAFVTAIDLNVSGYIIKPVDYDKMLEKLKDISLSIYQKQVISQKDTELKQYIDAINGVAIVTKTDLKGNITYANRMFTEVSGYPLKELIGSPHNIVRHPEVPTKAYEEMWERIQSGKSWKGTIKNKAKDGTAYFVKSYVFPLFDDTNKIKEYMGIRILMTDEENEKRQFKKDVVQTITKNRMSESQLKKENAELKKRVEELQQLAIKGDDNRLIALEQELLRYKKTVLKLQHEVENGKTI